VSDSRCRAKRHGHRANGVTWTRRPEANTTPEQFLAALREFLTMYSPAASWNWWREGQAKEERKRIEQSVLAVLLTATRRVQPGVTACADLRGGHWSQ
jgi:hypothetical protein